MRSSAEGAYFDRHQSAPDYARGAGLCLTSSLPPAHMVCTKGSNHCPRASTVTAHTLDGAHGRRLICEISRTLLFLQPSNGFEDRRLTSAIVHRRPPRVGL